jgi:hypothetical protein
MEGTTDQVDALLRSGTRRLTGYGSGGGGNEAVETDVA